MATSQAELISTIKAHIAAGDKLATKANNHYIAAGQHLKTLKANHSGTWSKWEELLKTKIGIGKSRASELMQIADGRKTVEQVRIGKAESMKRLRKRGSPPRGGEKAEDAKPSASRAVAVVEPVEVEEDDSFLDEEGNFAPVDRTRDPSVRIRGFLFRAEEAARGARMDDLAGLTITREMQDAAADALKAWADLARRITTQPVKAEQAREFVPVKLVGNDPGPIPEFLLRVAK